MRPPIPPDPRAEYDHVCKRWVVTFPYWRPPTFRAVLWAWFRGWAPPEWEATDENPNPRGRRWRRG